MLLSVSLFIHFGFACEILFLWYGKLIEIRKNPRKFNIFNLFRFCLRMRIKYLNERERKSDVWQVRLGFFFCFSVFAKNHGNNIRISLSTVVEYIFVWKPVFTAYRLLLVGLLRHSLFASFVLMQHLHTKFEYNSYLHSQKEKNTMEQFA